MTTLHWLFNYLFVLLLKTHEGLTFDFDTK